MRVERAAQADDELVAAFARLLPQLSTDVPPPGPAELMEIVATRGNTLLVARADNGAIAGVLTLITYRAPSGLKARIEDVVVDEAARGQGIGEALTREALRLAELAGARQVDLTSRTHREAAHRLYLRLGFQQHETQVFRYRP